MILLKDFPSGPLNLFRIGALDNFSSDKEKEIGYFYKLEDSRTFCLPKSVLKTLRQFQGAEYGYYFHAEEFKNRCICWSEAFGNLLSYDEKTGKDTGAGPWVFLLDYTEIVPVFVNDSNEQKE